MDICKQLFHKSRSPQLFNRIVFLRTPQNAAQHPQPAVNHYRHIAGMFFFGNGQQPLLMEDVLVISRKFGKFPILGCPLLDGRQQAPV